MDAVAYMDGDDTPKSYHHMKVTALAWCLARKKFMKMQSRTNLLSEHDPDFLIYLFPHLDPWGIGGFLSDIGQKNSTSRSIAKFIICYYKITCDFRPMRDLRISAGT